MVATGGEIFARTAKTQHPTVGLLRGGRCPYKNRCGTVRVGTRYARHHPYPERDSRSRQLMERGLSAENLRKILYHGAARRVATKPLRRMVATGGEIFARTAKTPHPTVGLLRGGHCDVPRAGCHLRPVGVACIIEPRKPLIDAAACHVATKNVASHGCNGRGNLRADREDPAPYSRASAGRPLRRTARRLPFTPCGGGVHHRTSQTPYKRRGTPRRYALREMELRD